MKFKVDDLVEYKGRRDGSYSGVYGRVVSINPDVPYPVEIEVAADCRGAGLLWVFREEELRIKVEHG